MKSKLSNSTLHNLLKFSFFAILLLIIPVFFKGYNIRFATTILFYIALAQAWNIIGGFTGYISLGVMGLAGMGSYLTAILMVHFSLNFFLSVILSALLTMIFSLVISGPILRLKSGYFAIATYAVAYVLRVLANNLTSITGGGMGMSLPMMEGSINESNSFFYYLMLVISVVATLIVFLVSKSRLGYGLLAIKEDEEAANVLGVNTRLYKVIAFGISCFIAGLIGGINAYWLVFIEPISVFNQSISILIISMVLVGGGGTVLGPVLGAAIVAALSEFLWARFLTIHQGILGLLLVLIVLFLPKGIMFFFRDKKGITGLSETWNKHKRDLDSYKV